MSTHANTDKQGVEAVGVRRAALALQRAAARMPTTRYLLLCVCVCAFVRVCVRVCVRACVRACVCMRVQALKVIAACCSHPAACFYAHAFYLLVRVCVCNRYIPACCPYPPQ
jgi:hypothetical protein